VNEVAGDTGRRYAVSARAQGRPPLAYRLVAGAIVPVMRAVSTTDWRGAEHLPPAGQGFVVAVNHISHADPFAVAHFLHANGHPPHFLGKAELFTLPVLGRLMYATGQVPVHRGSGRAAEAFRDAVSAVRAGQCVVIMPESTITRDPDLWPMTPKTGAARIALSTGCPVIPVAQWGAADLMTPYGRVHPFPRKALHMLAGPAVELSDLPHGPAGGMGAGLDMQAVKEATERIMRAITTQLETLRGESAPTGRWDPQLGRRVEMSG
jgi:1-acyl-sn-glycerol-3-phosphate acyltransferase